MDALLNVFVFFVLFASAAGSFVLTRRILNPVIILVASFFVPMWLASMRLSALQSNSWDYDTVVVFLQSVGAWLIFPLCVLVSLRIGRKSDVANGLAAEDSVVRSMHFAIAARIWAVLVLVGYLTSNYVQAHSLIPLFGDPEALYRAHNEFPPALRFFARGGPAAALLLYLCYFGGRRRVDLLLLGCMILLPMTRLSRIDVIMTFVGLAVLYGVRPLWKLRRIHVIVLIIVGCASVLGAIELGNQRTNRFGTYSVSYEKAIGWKPAEAGPSGAFAVAYGYVPLSFENFDRYVNQAKYRKKTWGAMSLSWLFFGLKLNWIPGFGSLIEGADSFEPVSGAANVPTSLFPFYSDFGVFGVWLPMIVYMTVLCFFYSRSGRSYLWLALYGLYAGAFTLSGFQALIAAPIIFHQLVEIVVVFLVAQSLSRRELTRQKPAQLHRTAKDL
ncbi:oligosaccharide repeat unit polymerase [Niveibacterium sp. 24ML]|uniref:O-antigen polymerase n=1 Tax=Niveibacterium sp. 24ML TaxID=2985512 RepID=UPI00226F4147|nr:O-antigen polymerase [Niveibacterium sp. 24ML]MCX9156664.1 oligosaccharide repeat unit polymerase [Niveibacterium sp. 24ML]